MSRQRGLQLEAFGCILIITVMLTDRFLFTLQDRFLLACAFLSAITLILGIRTVRRADERAENEKTAGAKTAPVK